jgi:peptidoglycan/LPS O-acetylase OafA/YrhL
MARTTTGRAGSIAAVRSRRATRRLQRAKSQSPETAATAWRSDPGFRPDIEGLRGLAVLLVVVFHAGLALPGGFIGVDVFFVISGFLITGLLLRERELTGRIHLIAFYARRVRRLLPAAIVVLAVTLPLAYGLYAPLDRAEVLLDGAASALSVGNIRFALAEGDYFHAMAAPSPFLHFWSLGVEEQFYFVWPALLLLAAGGLVAARQIRISVGAVLLIVFGASLGASIMLTEFAASWAFYSLPTRAFELAAGGLLAVGAAALARVPGLFVAPLGWLGLAAVCWSAVAFDSSMAFPGWLALVPTLGTAGIIAAGQRRFGPGALMSVEPMRFVGRISYSLYLWHWPVLVLAGLAFGFREPGLLGGVVLICVSLALATLSWALIEEPFRRGLPALVSRPGRTVFAGVGAVLAVVVAANGMAFASNRQLSDAAAGLGPISAVSPGGYEAPDEEIDPFEEDTDPADDEDVIDIDEPLPEVILPDEEATPRPGPTVRPTQSATASPTDPVIALPTDPTAEPDPTAQPTPAARTPRPEVTPRPTRTPKPTRAPQPTDGPEPTVVAPPPPPPPGGSEYALRPDVQPSLMNARNDKERIWSERCLGSVEHTAPRPGCVYGDKGAGYTVALIGDSHAAHWFPALEWVAQKNGWRLLVMVKVSCTFTDMPVRNIMIDRAYPECSTWNENVVARLNEIRPNVTIVGNSKYVAAANPADNNANAKAAGIARMIGRLPGKVILMNDTPRSAYDVPACLSANMSDIRACATPKRRALSGHGVLERKVAQLAGIALIDLAGRICVDSPCPAVVDNMIVYRDSHHLTATFSRALGPDLQRVLKQVL